MTIYVVSEENHGEIIYAASLEAAKRALIETDWVNENMGIWLENKEEKYGHYELLTTYYGENWQEGFLKENIEALERMGFYISEHEVCE